MPAAIERARRGRRCVTPAPALTASLMNSSAPMIASGAMITLMRNDHRHE